MFKLICFCFLIFSASGFFGQNISKKDALTDLHFLNEAVINGHPVNYAEKGKFNINNLITTVSNLKEDSFSVIAYRFYLGNALQQIGCVHTSIVKNPLLEKQRRPVYFPLKVVCLNGKLYVAGQSTGKFKEIEGKEIIAVNTEPAEKIVASLLSYSASDGGGTAFAKESVNRILPALLSLYFNYSKEYSVKFTDREIVLAESEKNTASVAGISNAVSLLENNTNRYYIKDSIAVIKLTGFSKSDVSFFNKVFQEIDKTKIKNLVIDLRGNTGGNRKAAVSLTKHLVDSAFSYSILQPKLKTGKYLNGKGKFFLFLSKLKYNVGDIFKGRKTKLGREFRYKYSPAKNPFNGKVFVITDGLTVSASTMVTSWLKQSGKAVFVGRQSGGGFNGNNGGSFPLLTLPFSKTVIKFPAYRLILDPNSKQTDGIIPDFVIQTTISDLINGVDGDLNFISDLIKKEKN
ncbi:MAG: S41 family peptidase [Bacteroidia bacterium]|nr:S41 family peptidase [Bacteroidia bacterium]